MKSPQQCTGLHDIRQGIDSLDAQLVELLRQRMQYVLAAAAFKPDQASIAAPERVASMLAERRGWAEDAGLDSKFILGLFGTIIPWYIEQQTAHWLNQREQP
ncbi:isochorismate lyase [Pseudomonas sp. PA27(2017)]|uniref:isochorismate lyase n=1 Tax=Pseudomonas sp. PA27(2017) TaxID=1932112 RepID=UPI00096129E6|nr:isochorismate lyase [Pseudomonas sp. PA27(2017)]OLU33790.1 isochorismate-pyruvate lyase [Pseudomonas sp. PA27(2017)]